MVKPITLFWTSTNTFISTALSCNPLEWNGSYIGEIKKHINLVPRTIVDRIVYFTYIKNEFGRIGDYGILEKYTDDFFYIEKIKELFGMARREYHLCTYKGKPYFIYYSYPDFENSLTINKIAPQYIIQEYRHQILLAWILGISTKLWRRGNILYTRKYGDINFLKNDLKKVTIKRFFPSKIELYDAMNIFRDQEKLDQLNILLESKSQWYGSIMNRISSI